MLVVGGPRCVGCPQCPLILPPYLLTYLPTYLTPLRHLEMSKTCIGCDWRITSLSEHHTWAQPFPLLCPSCPRPPGLLRNWPPSPGLHLLSVRVSCSRGKKSFSNTDRLRRPCLLPEDLSLCYGRKSHGLGSVCPSRSTADSSPPCRGLAGDRELIS